MFDNGYLCHLFTLEFIINRKLEINYVCQNSISHLWSELQHLYYCIHIWLYVFYYYIVIIGNVIIIVVIINIIIGIIIIIDVIDIIIDVIIVVIIVMIIIDVIIVIIIIIDFVIIVIIIIIIVVVISQVVEIASLTDHLLKECESKTNFSKCPRCSEAIIKSVYDQHVADKTCNREWNISFS